MSDELLELIIDQALGRTTPCSHAWRHTVYGSVDPEKNGTTCVLCGHRFGRGEL